MYIRISSINNKNKGWDRLFLSIHARTAYPDMTEPPVRNEVEPNFVETLHQVADHPIAVQRTLSVNRGRHLLNWSAQLKLYR